MMHLLFTSDDGQVLTITPDDNGGFLVTLDDDVMGGLGMEYS